MERHLARVAAHLPPDAAGLTPLSTGTDAVVLHLANLDLQRVHTITTAGPPDRASLALAVPATTMRDDRDRHGGVRVGTADSTTR